MNLRVTRAALAEMRADTVATAPEECCGILLGQDARIEAAVRALNVHPDPRRHFEIDPQTLIDAHRAAREGGPQVVGYYHSHPMGAPAPSATDREEAAHDDKVWAIAGEGDVTFWRDGEDGFAPLSYEVEDS